MPLADPIARAAYQKQYRQTHRDAFRRYDGARPAEAQRARHVRWYAKHRDAIRARHKARRDANPSEKRASVLRQYGLTVEEYAAMARAQGGLCAICQKPPTRYSLAVDHDHVTGKVRALLCAGCNVKVGMLESPLLATVTAYLEKHRGY